jgi:hypothetical protein
MGRTLPSLKAVQEQLGDGGGKMVYVFVSPKTDSFAQDCAALKAMPIGSNHQWINRSEAQYSTFFGTRPGDKVRWWVPTFLLLDADGNLVGWWRTDAIDWRAHIEQLRGLIASAQARKWG